MIKLYSKLNCGLAPYLRRAARSCIFAVHEGTARIVLIQSLRPTAHVISTSYLYPVLQNNIELLSTEYPRPKNSTWLEKVKRIF